MFFVIPYLGSYWLVECVCNVTSKSVGAAHSGCAVFARLNTGIVVSKPIQGMDVCVCVSSMFVLSCV
jgi:hypothetical protein